MIPSSIIWIGSVVTGSVRSRRQEYRRIAVYLVTCVPNGKRYVGITTQALARRWWVHCHYAGIGSDNLLARAIRKYGREAFIIEHIADSTCWEDACEVERALIIQYATRGNGGYNTTGGGDGTVGRKMSAENKRKLTEARQSDAYRASVSARFKGIPKSETQLGKLRGRKISEATRALLKSQRTTPEYRARISAQMRAFYAKPSSGQSVMEL